MRGSQSTICRWKHSHTYFRFCSTHFLCRSFYIFLLVLLAMGSLHPPAVHLARRLTFSPPTPTDFFACTWTPLLTMAELPRIQPTFPGRYVSGLVAPSRRVDLPPPPSLPLPDHLDGATTTAPTHCTAPTAPSGTCTPTFDPLSDHTGAVESLEDV